MVTEHRTTEFNPQFAYIPFVALPGPRDTDSVVDPKDCTLLHLDAESGNSGWLYSKAEWESGRESKIYRESSRGECSGLGEGDIVSLLPDMAIVKMEERTYWTDEAKRQTKAIYAVYAINLRQYCHICSVTPSYEAYYLCTQYDEAGEQTDDEREALDDLIREGALANNPFSYFDCSDIERILKNECREGFNPANHKSGGYRVDTGMMRTEDGYRWCEEKSNTSCV